VSALTNDAVHPTKIERYLSNWAAWWNAAIKVDKYYLLSDWLGFVEKAGGTKFSWLARSLLLPLDSNRLTNDINLNQEYVVGV
jgi:hypothetical protein